VHARIEQQQEDDCEIRFSRHAGFMLLQNPSTEPPPVGGLLRGPFSRLIATSVLGLGDGIRRHRPTGYRRRFCCARRTAESIRVAAFGI
jgi:hypothetical protein